TSIGRHDATPVTETVRAPLDSTDQSPAHAPTEPPTAPAGTSTAAATPDTGPARLVDEAAERGQAEQRSYDQAIADTGRLGEPPVFGGEEIPAQPSGAPQGDWPARE